MRLRKIHTDKKKNQNKNIHPKIYTHLQSSPTVNIYWLQLFLEDAVPCPLSKQLPLEVEQLSPVHNTYNIKTMNKLKLW